MQTLLLLQDNGPESHSRRTQFMQRMVQAADQLQLTIHLTYYPPSHSKYNPVERLWGMVEQHWNGSLLDSAESVLNFARTLSWRQQKPLVRLVERVYHKGRSPFDQGHGCFGTALSALARSRKVFRPHSTITTSCWVVIFLKWPYPPAAGGLPDKGLGAGAQL